MIDPPCLEPQCDCCHSWDWLVRELRSKTEEVIVALRKSIAELECIASEPKAK